MVDHLERGQFQMVGVAQIGFGESDHTGRRARELENAQVLLGLGHPSLVGVHHEEAAVDAAHSGQHVPEITHVTRNVDERDPLAVGRVQVREPQIDGESAFLFLGPTIGVGAGEGLDERGLAVVHVTGGGENAHVSGANAGWRPPRGRRPDRSCARR